MIEDELLKLRFKAVSIDALQRIYQKYRDYLLTLAMVMSNDTAGAEDPDTALYVAAADELGDGFDPVGAGTVTFRSFMNLWSVLVGLDEVTPEAIVEAFRAKVDEPSFMGHPYTCDGEQLDGLPAICSPQQVLVQMTDGALDQLGGWVDVGSIPGA